MCKNRKGLVVGCLLIICVISGIIALILSLVGFQDIYLPSPNKYGLVFDAGSSHTSLYIYQWPADKENDTGIVRQISMCDVQGKGISSYADNPALAGESLKECMNKALTIIPESRHKETTTLLGATAGMRLLNVQNATTSQRIFEEITKTLSKYPVNFQGARILTGNEEGSLGWITVNYLLGTFITLNSLVGGVTHPEQTNMVGAMDLGGASTQMTFHPSVKIENKDTEMSFRLYGYNYTIYTHSYLCYGQDQALKKLLAEFIQNSTTNIVSHPCYPKGYKENFTLTSVYNSPCLTTSPGNLQVNVTVEGQGNPGACRQSFFRIFNFSQCNNNANCSFNGVYQPPLQGKFYAFSAFYYTFNFLNMTCGQSLSSTNSTIWNYCTQDWSTLLANHPQENRKRLSEYCSSAMYILTLLLDGYKFNEQNWKTIQFSKQAGNADIGWTLGYMLNLTNMIPSEKPVKLEAYDYSPWVAAIFFIVLSIAAAIVASGLYCFCRNS
ncbi:ectonucleoside triphosphate diphosphohydrolase 8 isoform X2 [Bombina bombina]|nr:ectonucleoside triphosphate diphosphohydrolase 8 isoform X2 [Bombina bombina]